MTHITSLDGNAIVRAVNTALQKIDTRLVDHGERVAFIARELALAGNMSLDYKALLLLSIFHDIGAYKTDEIDRMVEFETHDVTQHSVYGYLFLKYMTPLSDMSEAIRYHHTPWDELVSCNSACKDYAALIHLADRIDIVYLHRDNPALVESLKANTAHLFCPEFVQLFFDCYASRRIFERLADGSYKKENENYTNQYFITADQALAYLWMLVFSIDFRSECTITHTVNTLSIAQNIASHFGLDTLDCERIYLGALLHDVGKIAIPSHILEFPGRLSPEQMEIMRTHVSETELLIKGIVPEEICRIAARHHEKLDGSGYPHGLTGDALTFPERIVAVADIVSALGSRRSYKEPFPKDKVLSILHEMRGSQLDARVCDYVCADYDTILHDTDIRRNEVIDKYQAMLEEYTHMISAVVK